MILKLSEHKRQRRAEWKASDRKMERDKVRRKTLREVWEKWHGTYYNDDQPIIDEEGFDVWLRAQLDKDGET